MITTFPPPAFGRLDPAVLSVLIGFGLLSWPAPCWLRCAQRRRGGPVAARRGRMSVRARRCLVWGGGAAATAVLVGGGPILVGAASAVALIAAGGLPEGAAPPWRQGTHRVDPWRTAALLDLFATSLEAGLPIPRAIEAVTEIEDSAAAAVLREVGRLLVLGASPADAWRVAAEDGALSAVAATAVRSAVGGVKVAEAARDAARGLRDRARAAADRSAARAEVTLTAPLALCFLPAFLCLGLAPVIIGLVGGLHLF